MSDSENTPPSEEQAPELVNETTNEVSEASEADATVNFVNESKGVCISCDSPSIRICTHCGQEFCAQHYCISHEVASERVPIVDEDGTEHRGQRVRLIGEGWPNAIQFIKDLSDDELDTRIAGLQERLKKCIQETDYTQISLAAHEYDRDYRRHSRYVAAVKRREKLVQGSVRLGGKKHTVGASASTKSAIPSDIAALMKLGGLSYEDAVKMKSLLGKAKP